MPGNLKKISEQLFVCLRKRKVYICLIVYLLMSCTALDTNITDSPQTVANDEKEITVPGETEQNNGSETPESQPANPVTADENNDDLPASVTKEPTSTTITSDVVIPDYEPLDLPFSEWEIHRSQELLDANGFGNTADEWRRAAQHSSGLIRSAAYYLLTQHLEQQDEALFRQGLDDIDQTVQTLSAYGLYRLGDKSVLPVLERIAQLDVNVHTAAPRAAGILAEIGEPTAFATIQNAINSDLGYIRLFAIQNAMPFVPLHGQTYTSGATIDIWSLYRQALQDENAQVRSVAILQLQELNSPEALELLQNQSKTSQ